MNRNKTAKTWLIALAAIAALPATISAQSVVSTQPAASTKPAISDAQKARLTPVVLAYRKAWPAVVNISAQKLVDRAGGIFGGDPFDDVFAGPVPKRSVQSLGSGVIIHPSGYIVTNAHVVRRAQKITVTLHDQTELEAKIISADPNHDLAVIKISPPGGKSLAFLPLGRSDDLMVGETVIAIGNPMGYTDTVTTGIISAVDRKLEFPGNIIYTGLIQTDAPINPGNSGGPLLNVNGEFIGINSAIRGDAQNIGFTIPVDALATTLVGLLDFERIQRVVFGAALTQRHGLKGDELIVTDVRSGTPADGKLQKGDRLLAIGASPMRQITDYACTMLAAATDKPLRLKCLRDGKEITVDVPLLAKARPDGKALALRMMGMTLRPIDKDLAAEMRLTVDRGLLVTDVDANGPAKLIGVHKRDVLFQVSQFYVKDLDDLATILEDVPPASSLRIGIVRGNVAAWATLKVHEPN